MGRTNDRRPRRIGAAGAADAIQDRAERVSQDQAPDRSQLEQIIAGLTEGVLLVEPDQTITYANEAALAMHGVTTLDELGRTVDEYRNNFVLRHQSSDLLEHGRYPIDRGRLWMEIHAFSLSQPSSPSKTNESGADTGGGRTYVLWIVDTRIE